MGTKERKQSFSSVRVKQGDILIMTAVNDDTVMASCIDGPSHKWAILLEVSHDTAPIAGSCDCAATECTV